MTYEAENKYKHEILNESLQRAGVSNIHQILKLQQSNGTIAIKWNTHFMVLMKMVMHLALFNRGTHQKQIVQSSSIARPEIDATANKICQIHT